MKTILLADDNKNIREFCKRELEDEGYRVLLAPDGQEAARIVQTEFVDLVILDLHMPVAGGFEAAELIKAASPSTPIMFFTACDEDCVLEQRSKLATACVAKSEDLSELKQVAARLMGPRDGSEPFRRSGLPPAPLPLTVDSTAPTAHSSSSRP